MDRRLGLSRRPTTFELSSAIGATKGTAARQAQTLRIMTSPADTQHCQDVRIACKRPQAANASLQKALSLPTSEPPNEADPTRRKIQLQPFQPTAKRCRTRLQSPSDLNDTEGNANLAPTSTNLQGESSVPVRNPDGTRVQPATVTSTHHLTETSPFGARLHTAKPFARFSVRRPLLEPFTRHTPHPAHRGAAVKADNGPRQQPKLASPFVQFKPRASFSPVPSQQQQPMPQTCQGGKATSRTANGSPDLETTLRKTASGAVNRTSSTSHIEETGESQRSHDPPEHANEPERSSTRRSGSKEQITYKASSVPLSSLDQQQDMPEQVISLQHAQQNSPEPQVQFVRETRAPTQHSFSIEKRNHRTPLPSREALFRSAKRRIGLRVSCSPRCSSPAAAPLQRNPEQSPPPKRLRRLEPLPAREKPSSRSCRSGSPTSPRKSCSGPQSSLRPNPSPRRIKSPSPLRRSPTRNAQTPNRPHHPSRTPPNYRHHSRLTPNSNYRSAIAEKNVRNPSPLLMTRSRTPSRPRYRSRTPSPRRPRSRTPTNYFRGRRTRSPPSPKYRASSQRGNRTHTQPKTNRRSSEPSRYGRRSPSPPRSIHRSRTPPRYGRRSYRSLRRIGGSRSRSRHRSRSRASPRRSISPRSRSPSRHSCHFRSPPRRNRRSRSRSRHGYRSRTPSRRIHRSRSRSMYGCRSRTPSRKIRRSRSRSSRGRRYPNLTRTCACYRSPSWHGRRSRSQPRSISPSRARSRRRRRFQTPPRRSSLSRSASPNGRRSCTPRRNGKRFHTSPRHSRSRSGAHSRDTSRSRTTPWLTHSSRISPRQTRAPPVPNYSSPARRTFTRKDDGDKDKSQTHSLDRPLRTEQPLPLKNSANGMQSTRNSAAGPISERRDCDNHKRRVQDKTEIIVIDSPGASGIAKPLQQSYTLQHVPSLKPVFEREKVQEAESAVPSGFKLSSLSLRQSNSDKAETVHLSSEIVVVDSPEGLKPPTPNQKLTKRRYEPRPTPAWMQTQKRPRLLSSPTKPRNHATSASGLPRDQANPGRWHDPKPTPPQQTRDTHVSKIPRGPRPLVEDHRTTLKFPGTALKEDLPKHKTDDISKLLLRPSSPSMKFKNEPKSSLANKTTTSNQFDVPSSDRATSTLPARTETANTNSCRETKRPMHLPAHTPSRVPTTLAAISGKTKKTHPLKTTHPPVPAKQEKVVVSGHSTVARPKEDHRFIAMLRQQPTTRSGTPLPRTVIPFDPFSMGSSSVRDSRKRLNVTKERTNAKELPTRDTKASYEFSDDPQITRLMLEYGLHVVERDEESNEVIWLACKFCICFTEVNRWLRNVKMFKTPFTEAGFKDHAKSVHDSVWSTYELAPSEAKEKLFEGRTLPSELLVSLRTGDLKQEDKRDTVTKGQRTAVGTCDIVRKEKIDEYRKIAQEEFKRNEESLKLLKESIPNPQEEA